MTDMLNAQPAERLGGADDLAQDYLVHRETTALADSIAAMRARVAARQQGQGAAQPAADPAAPPSSTPAPAGAPKTSLTISWPGMLDTTAGIRGGVGNIARVAPGIAKDVVKGATEAPRQILGGMSDTINRTFLGAARATEAFYGSANDLANWLNTNVADLTIGGVNPLTAAADLYGGIFRAAAGPEDPAARGFPEAQSVTGGVIRDASRFLTAFVPAMRALSPIGAGAVATTTAAGAVSDFVTADPNGERLADLWKKAGLPDNVLTDWLAQGANPDDGEVEKRFKNAIEGAGFGVLTEGVMLAARTVRAGMMARRAAEKGVGDGLDALAALRTEHGAIGERDFLLLGDPAKPVFTIDAADPGAKIADAYKATETGVPSHVAATGVARAAEDAVATQTVTLYRGTKPGVDPASTQGTVGGALFFSPDETVARAYAGADGSVLSREVSFSNLLSADTWAAAKQKLGLPASTTMPELIDAARRAGHDGITFKTKNGAEYIVIESSQGRTNAARETVDSRASREAGANPPDGGADNIVKRRIEINFAKINAPEDVRQVIDDMAQAFAPDIDTARRGVQSNEATKALADQLGLSVDDLLKRRKGEPLNAEQGLAARRLLNASAAKLLEISKIAASPQASPVDQFQFRKMMALHYAIQAEVIAARTETARALQAWSIPAGIGDIERSKAVTDMLANMGGPDVSIAMAKRLARLADQGVSEAALAAAVRKGWGAASMDVVREAYVLGLLWSPTTHIVNTSSNAIVALQQIQERALAADIGAALGRGDGVAPGEAIAMTWGLVSSLKDAMRLAGQAARDGHSNGVLGKVDMPREPAIAAAAFNLDQAGALGRTVDFAGAAVRMPGHLLAAQDAFFQSVGYRAELHARAWRQAFEEGKRGPDAGRRMAEIVANPPQDIRLAAADAAAYATFTSEPGGFAKKILALRNHHGTDNTIWSRLNPLFVILPFVRTPANVLSYTFERTPLAPLVSRWRDDIAAGGARADLAMARVATGTSIMLLAADLAANGQVTGPGPKDADEREALTRQGWQPNSIKIGDTYYAYNRLDPFGMMMSFAAGTQEFLSRGDIDPDDMDEWNEVFAGAIGVVSQTIVDKTFFTGVAQLFEVIGDPSRYGPGYINNLLGSFVPFNTALGFAERMTDPTVSEVNTPWDAVLAKIPGLSAKLTPKRNLWGETIKPQAVYGETFDATSPVRVSQKIDSPIDAEMTRLGMGVMRLPKSTTLDGVDVNLRDFPEAYDRLVVLAGNELKHPVWKLGLKDYLDAVVEGRHAMSPIYRMASDGKDGMKAEFIKGAVREFRQLAAQEVLADPRFADLAEIVGSRKADKAQKRMPVIQ